MRRIEAIVAALGVTLLAGLLVTTPVWAWTAVYSWTVDSRATTYRVEKSVDSGAAWSMAGTGLVAPSFTYTGTEPGLVLFRISNCNAMGCVLRSHDGLWHNEAWAPAGMPVKLGWE